MRVRFGSFVFDSGTRELLEGARRLHLSPKSFDLLQTLIERRPAVVSKAALQACVWPDAFVAEANVSNAVAEIRRALRDDPQSPAYICTVSRRGYRFCADAVDLEAAAGSRSDVHPRCWLVWGETILPLADGENIVGRHPASAVWINATSVSREHARIVIGAGRATIEDRASRNGTFVNGRRIARHPLVDGSVITFGTEQATFRQWSDDAAADTEPVRRP